MKIEPEFKPGELRKISWNALGFIASMPLVYLLQEAFAYTLVSFWLSLSLYFGLGFLTAGLFAAKRTEGWYVVAFCAAIITLQAIFHGWAIAPLAFFCVATASPFGILAGWAISGKLSRMWRGES